MIVTKSLLITLFLLETFGEKQRDTHRRGMKVPFLAVTVVSTFSKHVLHMVRSRLAVTCCRSHC